MKFRQENSMKYLAMSQIRLLSLTIVCAISLALFSLAGCRSGNSGSVSMETPNDPLTKKAELIQASFRTEGPDGPEAESDFHVTASGLKYRILRRGNGKRPTEYDRVQVSYRGWLDDGTVFDSSYKRGKPITFKLRNVVKGWTEGMQYVSEGGKIELEIPSGLGYGAQGSPPSVPPYATLHFIVELHEVY